MDTTKPADRSAEAAKVDDAKVLDAKDQPRTTAPAMPAMPAAERTVSQGHPLAGEPIGNVQHADRAVPNEAMPRVAEAAKVEDARVPQNQVGNVQRADRAVLNETTTDRRTVRVDDRTRRFATDQARPGDDRREASQPLNPDETKRLEELRGKRANPNVLPPDVRTEDEEHEFRKLAKADRLASLARDVVREDVRRNPRHRLDELKAKGQHLGEGETIEQHRIEDLIRDEERIDELKKMDKRVVEEDQELATLQQRAAEARAAGQFDPNG